MKAAVALADRLSLGGSVGCLSIAASFAYGSAIGAATAATRALFTPSMDPGGPLVARLPPPLAVTRQLSWDTGRCFDAWVATLVTAP